MNVVSLVLLGLLHIWLQILFLLVLGENIAVALIVGSDEHEDGVAILGPRFLYVTVCSFCHAGGWPCAVRLTWAF